jgi:hypothetical protein
MKMQEQSHIMKLIEPSAFLDDWYGWLTNQAGHILLGVFMAFFACLIAYFALGELPFRVDVFAACLFGYLAFELFTQGWQGYDTCEDTVFVVAYGCGAPLAAFHEVSAGSPDVVLDLRALMPFFVASGIHLACGVVFRYNRANDNKG